MRYCIIIPTYNNATTVYSVVCRALTVCEDVIVVNDGSTDNTEEVLKPLLDQIVFISYANNRGKGYALKKGFRQACAQGFDYAITLDADGQHCPEEIGLLVEAITEGQDNVLVVGSRNLAADGMPAANSFANLFSNFWFRLQTGVNLPDTQTGYRVYPLHHLPPLKIITCRYESELELLVFSAWRGVRLVPVNVNVRYAEDRVSHFRPFWDFFRISILNTLLCFLAVVYGYPRMFLNLLRGGGQ